MAKNSLTSMYWISIVLNLLALYWKDYPLQKVLISKFYGYYVEFEGFCLCEHDTLFNYVDFTTYSQLILKLS